MADQNIVLLGFMGTGKSTLARWLSQKLNRKAVSTDQAIEERQGQKIPQIFESLGEPHFRQLEQVAVEEIAAQKNIIVDCGGGVVLNPINIQNLKKNGLIVYLSASPEWILKRTQGRKHRPLLNVDDPFKKIQELLALRKPLYEQAADWTIDTDGKTNEDVGMEVLKKIGYV
jgi:shikimate kinase